MALGTRVWSAGKLVLLGGGKPPFLMSCNTDLCSGGDYGRVSSPLIRWIAFYGRAGQAIHDMWLRVTVDRDFNVVDAQAAMDAVPYPGGCEKIPPAYRKLIGLNLLRGFRKRVWELLGNVRGCTHLTEMLSGLPTAAIQTYAGERDEEGEDGAKPFQLDQCHALETSSETVKVWYPKWYRGKAA